MGVFLFPFTFYFKGKSAKDSPPMNVDDIMRFSP